MAAIRLHEDVSLLLISQRIDALVGSHVFYNLRVRYAGLIVVLENDAFARLNHIVGHE